MIDTYIGSLQEKLEYEIKSEQIAQQCTEEDVEDEQ